MNQMMGAIIVLGIAYAIYKLVELFARRNERMIIIEKMSSGNGAVNFPDVTKWLSPPTQTSWALRLGLLFVGIGLGLGIAVIMNFYMGEFPQMNEYQSRQKWDILYFAFMAFFGGLGLLFAYLIEQKNRKKDS